MLLQLAAELASARETSKVLEGAKADLLEQVAQWKEHTSKGEAELRELRLTLQQQTAETTATEQAHQEVCVCADWRVQWLMALCVLLCRRWTV